MDQSETGHYKPLIYGFLFTGITFGLFLYTRSTYRRLKKKESPLWIPLFLMNMDPPTIRRGYLSSIVLPREVKRVSLTEPPPRKRYWTPTISVGGLGKSSE
jgi:hypothetical protein